MSVYGAYRELLEEMMVNEYDCVCSLFGKSIGFQVYPLVKKIHTDFYSGDESISVIFESPQKFTVQRGKKISLNVRVSYNDKFF